MSRLTLPALVARNTNGPWVTAEQVRGLFQPSNNDEFDDNDENPDSEGFIDTDLLNYCSCESMGEYGIGDTTPEYLVLDCENTRVKVDLDGYILDDEDEPTECRLFNPDELGEREEYEEYETRELFDAKCDWVGRVLSASFPRETKLYLAER